MLALAITLLVLALFAGFLGFRGVANKSWEGAKLICIILLIVAAIAYFASRH